MDVHRAELLDHERFLHRHPVHRIGGASIFVINLAHTRDINAEYAKRFSDAPPARSMVQVAALPKSCEIEIEMTAKRLAR
jgi:enamine deaminase RidA (YjgF/YER057c/UK114 family)